MNMKENILIIDDEVNAAGEIKNIIETAGYAACHIVPDIKPAESLLVRESITLVIFASKFADGPDGNKLTDVLYKNNICYLPLIEGQPERMIRKANVSLPFGFLTTPIQPEQVIERLQKAISTQWELSDIEQRSGMLNRKLQLRKVFEHPFSIDDAFDTLQCCLPFDLVKIERRNRNLNWEGINYIKIPGRKYKQLSDPQIAAEMGIHQGSMSTVHKKNNITTAASYVNGYEFRRMLMECIADKHLSNHFGLQAKLTVAARNADDPLVWIHFYSQAPEAYNEDHRMLITNTAQTLAGILTSERDSKDEGHTSAESQKVNTVEDGHTSRKASGLIIGKSRILEKVLEETSVVADTLVTVLILGESGTGKELIANEIHKRSSRGDNVMIKVNCAALPQTLIEAELFGYEKGAFTGATDKRIGKFEAARGGTIFLDEIGELSLEAQAKLLRILQEQEFERLGGNKTIKANVRVIAATNRNLEKDVAQGRLRLDLYYRLNIFPIKLPPLRARKEDIPLLCDHFLTKFAKKTALQKPLITPDALKQLTQHEWPGNIRELEHLLERTLLRTQKGVIEQIDFQLNLIEPETMFEIQPLKTLKEIESDHIIEALKRCDGKIEGTGGAAEMLDLPPSTLKYKLKKHGLIRDFYHNI